MEISIRETSNEGGAVATEGFKVYGGGAGGLTTELPTRPPAFFHPERRGLNTLFLMGGVQYARPHMPASRAIVGADDITTRPAP